MNEENYIQIILGRLEKYFKMREHVKINNYVVDIRASYERNYGRTFISKVDVIDQYRDREEHLVKYFGRVDDEGVESYIENIKGYIMSREIPENHHCSQFIITVVSQTYNEKVRERIENFKFHKSHYMGLKGWTNIHIVYVVLDTKAVYTSKKAKHMKEVYTL